MGELAVMKDSANGAAPGEFVGDFRNGSLDFGWDTFDEETKLSKRAIELNNGRAAQCGLLGLMIHEKLNEIDMVADLPIIGALNQKAFQAFPATVKLTKVLLT